MPVCTKCREDKPAEGFGTSKRKLNGLQSWCRKCQNRNTTERNKSQRRREYMRQYYLNNQDKFRVYRANADRAEIRRRVKEWRKKNPERRTESNARRRFRKAHNGVFKILDRELKRLYSSPCVGCGTVQNITADHIVPLARGGRHSIGNLQPLCVSCNSSKNDKLMVEWRVSA